MRKFIQAQVEVVKTEARRFLSKHLSDPINKITKLLADPVTPEKLLSKQKVLGLMTDMVRKGQLDPQDVLYFEVNDLIKPEIRKSLINYIESGEYAKPAPPPHPRRPEDIRSWSSSAVGLATDERHPARQSKAVSQQVYHMNNRRLHRRYMDPKQPKATKEQLEQLKKALKLK